MQPIKNKLRKSDYIKWYWIEIELIIYEIKFDIRKFWIY